MAFVDPAKILAGSSRLVGGDLVQRGLHRFHLELEMHFLEPCPVSARPGISFYGFQNDRVTRRLAESVGRLCQVLSVKHVAEYFGLGWAQVEGRES